MIILVVWCPTGEVPSVSRKSGRRPGFLGSGGGESFGLVLEDESIEDGLSDSFVFGVESGDGLELIAELVVGSCPRRYQPNNGDPRGWVSAWGNRCLRFGKSL